MGLSCIKMGLRKNKLGFIISEALIIPFALLIVGLTVYMASAASIADEQTFEELTPQLSYEFPKVVIYSFLNFPIDLNDSKTFFGDEKFYTVSDLIWINSEESKNKVKVYRDLFIESSELDFTQYLDLYFKFSGERLIKNDLIYVKSNSGFILSLEEEIDRNNFYFRVPTSSDEDVLVYFKSFVTSQNSVKGLGCNSLKDC